MGKVIRRAVAVLLCATAVILAVLPARGAEATSVHGEYEYDGATVAKYLGNDTEVTLPAWVNRVGKEAFEDYDDMTKLVMTDTVTTVDFGAFSNCDNLATVKMGESVRTLGSSAFSGCTSLYSVDVPASVRTIGSGVFAGCPSLSSVPVSAGNRYYTSYDGVIYSSDGKKLVQYLAGRPSTTYRMPRTVREIEEFAFWGANNLSKLSIAYGVDKIPEYAFSNCKGLQHVTLPRTVQSIFAYAFENCDSLSYINIPDSIGYIDDRAFANTQGTKLRFVDAAGNVIKTFNSEDVDKYGNGTGGATAVEKPDYENADYEDTGSDYSDNTNQSAGSQGSDTAGSTSQNGGENTTDQGTGDQSTVNQDSGDQSTGNQSTQDQNTNSQNTGEGGQTTQPSPDSTVDNVNGSGTDQPMQFDPNDVAPLDPGDEENDQPSDANGYQSTPDNTPIPAPYNIISDNGVYNNGYYKASDSGSDPWNTQIEYVDYESNMTPYDLGGGKIRGGEAVINMSSNIPVKGFNFPNAEYEDTMMDTAANYGHSDSDVIGDVFASYSGDESSVKIPSGVKKIGDRAFYKDETLNNVDLPKSLSNIGEFAFSRSGLTNISIPEGTKNIDYAAFYRCNALSDVDIPKSVDSIGLGAFEGTPYIENWKYSDDGEDFLVVGDDILLSYKGREKKLIIPDNIKHIAPGAFSRNTNLESVIIPSSVSDIGEEAFCDCRNLHELILQDGLNRIDDRAFKNSNITALSIPDSVEGIGLGAFDNGGKLKTVIINGENVPNVTYNKSATRLSAKDLRTRAFEGVENAIVSKTCNIDDGTLFAPGFYGFDGEVYSIGSKENNSLILDRVLKQPDASGNVVINQQVEIAGEQYMLENVKSDAFDAYRNWTGWTDNKPVNVSVNGEQSDSLKALLDDVNSNVIVDSEAEEETAAPSGEGDDIIRSNITVNVDGKRFPTRGEARATIPGETDRYTLNITEDENAKESIDTAFLHDKGAIPDDYVPLSVDLYDKSGTVPIHKLGDSKLEVSMPVPSGMEEDDGIGIACLDDNGKLTQLSSSITDNNGNKSIDFVTGHCSTYVIYSRAPKHIMTDEDGNVIETVDGENAASLFTMSGTWQTLNQKMYGPVSVKWFIIVILFALSGILVIYDVSAKKRKTKNK